ncbi:MAG: MotA/TolQ/ExbB proton channel family protein [Deltaproteobacteria bacterium]|nr:MotA/TolQ/ExbB proton channel family protein [Candidatus Anaeroferrophillacea bacterium]
MVPIAAVSLLLWVLVIMKLQEVYELSRREVGAGEAVAMVVRGDDGSLTGTVLGHVVFHFLEQRTADRQVNLALLSSLVAREQRRLEQGLDVILVLATVAPLLGLLGTVAGMIGTFDSIAVHGTGNARAMAGGISEALITTQSGLFVSIPGLFMANFLRRRVEGFAHMLEEFRAGMMQTVGGPAAAAEGGR